MLSELPACELARRIRAGEASARDAVEACLSRIVRLDATPGTVTTVGQRSLAAYRPPGPEALSVRRLREAGAIVLGTTAVGSGMRSGGIERERLPAARNPWDPARTPGGSSSGSAVAVATGMCHGALGTDVGGSVRNPASFSGIVGLKPSHGVVPLAGNLYGAGTAFEHVGPMARTVADTRLLLAALAEPGTPGRSRGSSTGWPSRSTAPTTTCSPVTTCRRPADRRAAGGPARRRPVPAHRGRAARVGSRPPARARRPDVGWVA